MKLQRKSKSKKTPKKITKVKTRKKIYRKRRNPREPLKFYLDGINLKDYKLYKDMTPQEKFIVLRSALHDQGRFMELAEWPIRPGDQEPKKFELELPGPDNRKIIVPFRIIYFFTKYDVKHKYIVGVIEEHPIPGYDAVKIEFHDFFNVIEEKIVPINRKTEAIKRIVDYLKDFYLRSLEADLSSHRPERSETINEESVRETPKVVSTLVPSTKPILRKKVV